MGIMIKKTRYIKIDHLESISSRILIARLTIHNMNFKIIVVYAPLEALSPSTKHHFYSELQKHCAEDEEKPHQKLFVIGDFNATTSIAKEHCSFTETRVIENITNNDNGNRMLEFCRNNELCISNIWFK